jgi:WD40 repeat protein
MNNSNLVNDQTILVTASYDRTIRFWKANTGQCYRVLQHNESVSICFYFILFCFEAFTFILETYFNASHTNILFKLTFDKKFLPFSVIKS